jgi:hypothetical protein
MKVVVLVFSLITLLSVTASSQVLSFGLGADVTFPSADLKDNVATGYGMTGLVRFGLLPIVDLTGGLEYTKFTSKTLAGGVPSASTAFGVLVGGRVSVFVIGYVGAETGSYTFTPSVNGESADSYTKGFIAPMVGVKFTIFDLGARYVSAGNDSFWALRGLVWL